MGKTRVVVVYGGRSPEHEVSIQSGRAVIEALSQKPEKYQVLPVYITKEGKWLLKESELEEGTPAALSPDATFKGLMVNGLSLMPVDAVFPALHGKNGEDGCIQGLCALAGLPCVGSGPLSSAICMDKAVAKRLTSDIDGLGQVPFLTIDAAEGLDTSRFHDLSRKVEGLLGYPCFCKPINTGSSRGISKIMDKSGLLQAVKRAGAHDSKLIVEQAVSGRELEVGILGNERLTVSTVGEICVRGGFYDYDAKYTDGGADIIIPASVEEQIMERVKELALKIYRTLGCAGMARVDFFMEHKTNRIIFNEINTIPGFTPTSMYPKLFARAGLSMADLIDKLVELAIEGG